jgi:hypothetical protein
MKRRQFFKSLCLAPVALLLPKIASIDNDESDNWADFAVNELKKIGIIGNNHSDNQFDRCQDFVTGIDVIVDNIESMNWHKPIDTDKMKQKLTHLDCKCTIERIRRNV